MRWLNVKAFGALGDGEKDDAPAIQAAIDAVAGAPRKHGVAPFSPGGVVYIPASDGPYVLGSKLSIGHSLSLVGDGPGSMLYLADGVNDSMIEITHSGDSWVVLHRLTLEGNRFNQSGTDHHGIVVNAEQPLARYHDIFEQLYVRNCRGNGFEFVEGAPHRITNCVFNDNSYVQVHHGPRAIDNYVIDTIVGTDAAEPGTIGWHAEGSNNIWHGGAIALSEIGAKIEGLRNTVEGGTSIDLNRRYGVHALTNESRFVGLTIRGNSREQDGKFEDIRIDGDGGRGRRNVIVGCTFSGDGRTPYGVVEVNGAEGTQVGGCTFHGHLTGDVQLTGAGSFAYHRRGLVRAGFGPTVVVDPKQSDIFNIVVPSQEPFTINAADGAFPGQRITVGVTNRSGGRGGDLTWGTEFVLSRDSFERPRNGRKRLVSFYFDGARWIETHQTSGELPAS